MWRQAAPAELRAPLSLCDDAGAYSLLAPDGQAGVAVAGGGRDDASALAEMQASLSSLGFEGAAVDELFAVLGLVLQLGNLRFDAAADGGSADGSEVAEGERDQLELCAALLQHVHALHVWLCVLPRRASRLLPSPPLH